MRKHDSKLSRAGKIGAGMLIALLPVTPALAANWVTEWAENWSPPTGPTGYLFYGALGLFIVGVALKVFEAYVTAMETKRESQASVAHEEPSRAYTIGDHRNSILTP
jgi:hypothetical protein